MLEVGGKYVILSAAKDPYVTLRWFASLNMTR